MRASRQFWSKSVCLQPTMFSSFSTIMNNLALKTLQDALTKRETWEQTLKTRALGPTGLGTR